MTLKRETYFERFRSALADQSDLNNLKHSALLDENPDGSIFKYCGVTSASKILENNTILLQPPDDFNDPFDCLSRVAIWDRDTNFDPSEEDINFAREHLTKIPEKFRPENLSVGRDMRSSYLFAISCFSSKFDILPMWSHYANNHKGVCIEYATQSFFDDLHPCLYIDEIHRIDWRNIHASLALLKGRAWSYEQEWRVVKKTIRPKMRVLGSTLHSIYNSVHSNPAFGPAEHEEWARVNLDIVSKLENIYKDQLVMKAAPTKLILGANFSRNYSNESRRDTCKIIFVLARKSNIPIFRVSVCAMSYSLKLVEVTEDVPTWIDLNPELLQSFNL